MCGREDGSIVIISAAKAAIAQLLQPPGSGTCTPLLSPFPQILKRLPCFNLLDSIIDFFRRESVLIYSAQVYGAFVHWLFIYLFICWVLSVLPQWPGTNVPWYRINYNNSDNNNFSINPSTPKI